MYADLGIALGLSAVGRLVFTSDGFCRKPRPPQRLVSRPLARQLSSRASVGPDSCGACVVEACDLG